MHNASFQFLVLGKVVLSKFVLVIYLVNPYLANADFTTCAILFENHMLSEVIPSLM